MRVTGPGRSAQGSQGRGSRYAALLLPLLLAATAPAMAETRHLALVVGNGAYAGSAEVPALPGCIGAARDVAVALRGIGFEVAEGSNLGRGEADAAVARFARLLREAPGAIGVAYICGHLAAFNARPFLLPVTATLQRDSDLLTQGVLARLVVDAMLRAQAAGGLVVLDGFLPPNMAPAPVTAGLATLAATAAAGGIGLVATLAAPGPAPTPLPATLGTELAGPQVRLAAVLAGLRARLPPGMVVALGEPTTAVLLAGASPPPPPPRAAVAAPAAAPAAPPALAEDAMEDADRRRVQAALARMGYYLGQPDGRFGPNSRAAIRRFQFEMGTEMTGTLTVPEATRLLGRR
ncbi:caspase domain-containing protein [Humitalea rosea]|uniref:Caspase domain-containing protein n=1 Tax=Humitalea rosea TaxID=990373 RepID=A0A2W7IVR5_9PROT|nr:peptidoglycan-binding protein [Humitalea rosea]PZW50858.1 caspase domain-containing protein [Humitalea rosea]